MEASSIILGCLLLLQMTGVLLLLNPIYDVRRVTKYINNIIRYRRTCFVASIALYFGLVIYYGMVMPLQNIHNLISSNVLSEYEKVVFLSRIEKNYLIAGFSLFLFIVLYGIRSLVSYAANLLELSIATSESIVLRKSVREQKNEFYRETILPNLLRVKRSVSYETIMFANEFREQLKTILKNTAIPHNGCTISNILHSNVNSLCPS